MNDKKNGEVLLSLTINETAHEKELFPIFWRRNKRWNKGISIIIIDTSLSIDEYLKEMFVEFYSELIITLLERKKENNPI